MMRARAMGTLEHADRSGVSPERQLSASSWMRLQELQFTSGPA